MAEPPRIPVFERSRTVTDADTDLLGHVNNAVWVAWVIDLADAHASAVGLDYEATRRLGGVWVVRRHVLDYHRSAYPGDRLQERTWVSEMRGARCERHSRFLTEDGDLAFAADTRWAFLAPDSLRPLRVPATVEARFDPRPVGRMGAGT